MTTVNEEFKACWIRLYSNDGEVCKTRAVLFDDQHRGQDEWKASLSAMVKRRKLKVRKNGPGDLELLGGLEDVEVKALHGVLLAKWKIAERVAETSALADKLKARLGQLAYGVEFVPDDCVWTVVGECGDWAYSSQGYGAANYAKATLQPLAYKLQQLGIDSHIQRVRGRMVSGIHGRSEEVNGGWNLWAACPKWMSYAAEQLITLTDMSMACPSANLKVLDPWMPVDTLCRHFDGKLRGDGLLRRPVVRIPVVS